MTKKYIPSGAISVGGVLKTILFGTLAALILPIVYVVINKLIPNIWFAGITAILLGLTLGYFVDLGIKFGKIRNIKVASAIAIFCALLAFYVQWVFFDEMMYSPKGFTFNLGFDEIKVLADNMLYLFLHPVYLFNEIVKLNAVGTFRIDNSENISGVLLWIIWLAELLIIVLSVLFTVINGKVSEPYSEVNDQWMDKREPYALIPFVSNKNELLSELERNPLELLKNKTDDTDSLTFAQVIISESDGDPLKFFTIVNTTITEQKNGKEKVKKEVVLKNYPILDSHFTI